MLVSIARVAALLLAVATASSPARAEELPAVVFEGLKGADVRVEKDDGSEVAGQLLSFDDAVVVIAKSDGRIVTVKRSEIAQIAVPADVPVEEAIPSAPPAAPAASDLPVQLAELRLDASDARRSGIVNLAVWTPISLASLALGAYLIDDYRSTGEVVELTSGAAFLAFGVTGSIMFPIRGGLKLGEAGRIGRRADALESASSSAAGPPRVAFVAPVLTGDLAGVTLGGTF